MKALLKTQTFREIHAQTYGDHFFQKFFHYEGFHQQSEDYPVGLTHWSEKRLNALW